MNKNCIQRMNAVETLKDEFQTPDNDEKMFNEIKCRIQDSNDTIGNT